MAQLGDLIRPASLERCGDRLFPVLSMTMHDGIMLQSNRFKKSLASVDQSAYKVVRRNQLVVGFPIDEGVLYIQQVADAGIMSPAYDVWDVDKTKVDLQYFELCLHSPQAMTFYKTNLRGTTARRRSLPKETLLSLPVPVPSMERQREIASTIGRLRELIELRLHQLRALDSLIKARFVEMFGNPEAGTCYFKTEKLSSLSHKISDGVHAKPEYTASGRPFLSVVNINKGIVDFTDCKFVSEEAYQKMIKSTHPQKGDVLYTKVGATYGIPAYVDTDREFCLYVSVCLIKPNLEKINPRFLALQMAMPFIKHQADSRIKGIGVPDLHLNQISEFDIICPPREQQEQFVYFAEQVDKSKIVGFAA